MSERIIKINWSDFIKHTEKDEVEIPTDPGVYEYYSQRSGEKYRKYVGEAADLNGRFHQHLGEDEKNECLKKLLQTNKIWFFRYAIIEDEDDRKDAELGLWKKHKYECNVIEPPGSGRDNFKIDEDP